MLELFYGLSVMVVKRLYTTSKMCQTVHLKLMNFYLCK